MNHGRLCYMLTNTKLFLRCHQQCQKMKSLIYLPIADAGASLFLWTQSKTKKARKQIFYFLELICGCNYSLCPERQEIVRACTSTCLNQFRRTKFVCSNKYYKHCIISKKIVFTIIFLIMNFNNIFNKNLHNKNFHNNKLHNGLETQAHFLEISLKFEYF